MAGYKCFKVKFEYTRGHMRFKVIRYYFNIRFAAAWLFKEFGAPKFDFNLIEVNKVELLGGVEVDRQTGEVIPNNHPYGKHRGFLQVTSLDKSSA